MKKIQGLIALLLALVLLLGVFPVGVMAKETCAHANVEESVRGNGNKSHTTVSVCKDCGEKLLPETNTDTAVVRVDFRKFAQEAAKQDWWKGLRAAVGESVKYVGNTDSSNTMGPYVAAYDAMLAYLDEHENWNIDESISNFKGGFKRLYWCCDDSVPWALSYYTYYQGGSLANRSRLAFTVEAEKEGWYDLSIDLFKEKTTYTERRELTGDYPGGGAVEIHVNDELVCEKLNFNDTDSRKVENIGRVWLNEGDNSVVFTALHSYSGPGDVVSGRFNVSLNAFAFVMAPQPELAPGAEMTVDPNVYAPFSEEVIMGATHSVVSSDEAVAEVAFDENDRLVIRAVDNGIAEVAIRYGGKTIATVTVTVGDGKTEACVDEEENGICDICEDVCGECKHKSTTVEIVDNGDGTRTTTETCNYCGTVVRNYTRSDKEIVMDFKEFARDASRQEWWDELIHAGSAETRMIGSASPDAAMTAGQLAAYEAMQEHLALNYQWNIDEEITGLTRKAYWKRLFINHSDDVPWGLLYFPIYHSSNPDRAKLAFTVVVPEGRAGFYHMDLSVFKEDTSAGAESITGTYSGGGFADIYVNGKLMYDEYSFRDANLSRTDSLGAVYLEEGTNSVVIDSTYSYSYDDYTGRCNLDLEKIHFTLLEDVEVQEYLTATVDLKSTYLSYDYETAGLTVEVTNELIVSADVNADGIVSITGVGCGEAAVVIYRGEEELCTIPVKVGAFEGSLDDLAGNTARLDFVNVLNKAAQEPFWTELEDGTADGEKRITVEDTALHSWIEANTGWSMENTVGTVTSAIGTGLTVAGSVELTAAAPAAGLYNVAVEAAGSGKITVSVNGESLYEGLTANGGKQSIGTAQLDKTGNTITVQVSGKAELHSIILTPLGVWNTEQGRDLVVDLTETYLPYDAAVSSKSYTVSSSDNAVAAGALDADGDLVITGKSQGQANITVTGPNGFTAYIRVNVAQWSEFAEVVYTIDGFKAETLQAGSVAKGALRGLTAGGAALAQKQLYADGDVYYATSDRTVATVDQRTGDVHCHAEGTAAITAYVLLEGVCCRAIVNVHVSDDTDLAAIRIKAPVDYMLTGNTMQLSADGLKASGRAANMENFPVVYSLADTDCATVTADGLLTALQPGTVEVIATAGVQGVSVTDTLELTVVDNLEMTAGDVAYDFTYGRVLDLKTATVEKDGIEIDWDNTYLGGSSFSYAIKSGLSSGVSIPVDQQVAFNVQIPVDGWYTLSIWNPLESYGATVDVFVDDIYAGAADFNQGGNTVYDGRNPMNTIYLTAGVHSYRLVVTKTGYIMIGRLLFSVANEPSGEMTVSAPAELLVGQTVTLEQKVHTEDGNFKLKQVASKPAYSNYCIVTSSNTKVIKVTNGMLQAVGVGTARITAKADINGQTVTRSLDITVAEGNIVSVEAQAQPATLKPYAEGTNIVLTAYGVDGAAMNTLPEGVEVSYESLATDIADVDETGAVSITGKQGTARIEVTVKDGSRVLTCTAWVTVTEGKTAPSLFTEEERANARENVLKYDWAWRQKEAAVRNADYVVEHLDEFYRNFIFSDLPRIYHVGTRKDPEMYYCRYCKEDLSKKYTVYPWLVDPINNPWKITCPACKRDFPSNDFGAYFESGLQENGRFDPDKADKGLLVNELYPEMGEGWGVDDGFGYLTGNVYPNGAMENHYYIAYYVHSVFYKVGSNSKHSMTEMMTALINAYLYTGDEKYGNAGAILIDRIADIYPEFDFIDWIGDWDTGKFTDAIWEANTVQPILAKAADAFWPCMTNDEVVQYLRNFADWKGIPAEEITPEQIRSNVEENVLLEIKRSCENGQSFGNFGMHQSAMAYAAVALDRLPESAEMIDWVFRDGGKEVIGGETVITGGDLMDSLVNRVDRDGFGDEGSDAYNRLWYQNLMEVADALNGYTRVENADLWKNPKFVSMFGCYTKLNIMGRGSILTGENGSIQQMGILTQADYLLQVFQATGDREVARNLYFINGNSTNGLHGDIFMKNPEAGIRSAIQKIVDEDGPYVWQESEMLCGHGMAILRNGPETLIRGKNEMDFSDYWLFFGINGGTHGTFESLTLSVDAFGLAMTPNMGYPTVVNEQDPQRMQWIKNTVSHNTVVVDDEMQSAFKPNAFPLHFDDSGMVKVMDAESPNAYPKTDIYRRTVVSVQAQENVYYAVDFFRVLGGSEHVYSFHAATMIDPETTGLTLDHQAMGTYAGPDIPYGDHTTNPYSNDAALNTGSGYSWLDDVYRDADPETAFTVDWQIQDFQHALTDASGVHLKLHMLSEEPMTEVALANGHPPTRAENPDYLEFMLVRKSGQAGMDTLFTTVIEPYRYDAYIAAAELVDVELVSGEDAVTDKAVAMKVTMHDGRVDYIVYATEPANTYRVDDLFDFSGAIGVCSYRDGRLVYAYGNEATQVATAVTQALPAVTGTVAGFTEGLADSYTMTVNLDQDVTAEDLAGRYIYVNNDSRQNGAYRIYGAEVDGNVAVLDLHTQTLTRSYLDAEDMDAGFLHNIAVGQDYTIPLSVFDDSGAYFASGTDKVVKAGNKLSLTVGAGNAGVTYAAEGLPTGARFDEKTGTITWTTSRTQTGRYPISVKALKDGGPVGEISFVIYVVSYTGSAYDASICTHAKLVTYEVEGFIETVCPACGTVTRTAVGEEPEVEKFDLVGSNMTLGNELKVNVMANTSDLQEGCYAKITHNGKTVEADFARYNSTYSFVSVTVAAAQMADEITVEVFDENGNAVSNVYTTSVRSYAMGQLNKASAKDKTKVLLVDMLNYGAAAQESFGYNTEDLANSLLTEEQQALATAPVETADRRVKGENYYGSNLSLEEKILLNFYFKGVEEGMYAEITFGDTAVRMPFEEFGQYSGDVYRITVDDIALAQSFDLVTVTVCSADGTVHGTATDSVESYIARSAASALNEAIMKFAASAKVYFS